MRSAHNVGQHAIDMSEMMTGLFLTTQGGRAGRGGEGWNAYAWAQVNLPPRPPPIKCPT